MKSTRTSFNALKTIQSSGTTTKMSRDFSSAMRDMSRIKKDMADIERSAKRYSDHVKTSAANMKSAARSMAMPGGGMGSAGGMLSMAGVRGAFGRVLPPAIAAYVGYRGLTAAVGHAASTQKALAFVGTQLPSGTDLGKYKMSARDIAMDTGLKQEDVLMGMYNTLSAQISPEKTPEVLRVASRAAVAGGTTVDVMSKAINQTLNAFRLDAGEAENVSNSIFGAVQGGVFEPEEMANSMGEYLAMAAKAGVSYQQAMALQATSSRGGLNAAESATSVARFLQVLGAPTPQSEEAFAAAGINIDKKRIQEDFSGIITDIAHASDDSLAKLHDLVPDIRALKQAMLTSPEAFEESMKLVENGAASAKNAFEQMSGTVSHQKDRLVETLGVLSDTFFEETGILSDLGDAAKYAAQWLRGDTHEDVALRGEKLSGLSQAAGSTVNSFGSNADAVVQAGIKTAQGMSWMSGYSGVKDENELWSTLQTKRREGAGFGFHGLGVGSGPMDDKAYENYLGHLGLKGFDAVMQGRNYEGVTPDSLGAYGQTIKGYSGWMKDKGLGEDRLDYVKGLDPDKVQRLDAYINDFKTGAGMSSIPLDKLEAAIDAFKNEQVKNEKTGTEKVVGTLETGFGDMVTAVKNINVNGGGVNTGTGGTPYTQIMIGGRPQ